MTYVIITVIIALIFVTIMATIFYYDTEKKDNEKPTYLFEITINEAKNNEVYEITKKTFAKSEKEAKSNLFFEFDGYEDKKIIKIEKIQNYEVKK